MNTLQRFKIADAIGQVLITPALYILTEEPVYAAADDYTLLACYLFGVGAWQATSCLVWAIAMRPKFETGSRKAYSWLLLTLCAGAIFGWICYLSGLDRMSNIFFLVLVALLVLGPVMSVWYFILTITEVSALGAKQSQS